MKICIMKFIKLEKKNLASIASVVNHLQQVIVYASILEL